MSASERDKIQVAIIGAGLMGHGIAQVFACAGHAVRMFDQNHCAALIALDRVSGNLLELGLDPSAVDNIVVCSSIEEAVVGADLVIDSIRENLADKQALFQDVERFAPDHAILASNTSVIPITQIMQGLRYPERALGTHWWNPPFLVPLVEVVCTEQTDPDVAEATMQLLRAVGKHPVLVRRDIPGFIGNRLQHALWREAISLVQSGVCDAETIDDVVKLSFGMRMGVLGPMENADLVGTDLTLAVHEILFPDLDRSTQPLHLLRQLAGEGNFGMRNGQGFRRWTDESAKKVRADLVASLMGASDRVPISRCTLDTDRGS